MPRTYLKDLRRGDTVSDTFLVESANFKQTRNGKYFIQMMLRDRTAAVKALRWEATREEFRQIDRNPFLHVQGRVEEFQGAPQVIVDEFESLSAEDARVDPTDFLPRTKHDIDAMARELDGIVASLPNADVRRLTTAILDRPGVRDGLRAAPAGKVMHHAYVGGLLEHIISLARLADSVLQHYTWLDRSILLAGVILHDIGKIEELSYRTGFGYTDEGQLVGHIVMGATWIDEAARNLGDVDPEVVLELKHLVASHHGKLEYGSPKTPMTAEALALHFLDNLDAKLAAYQKSWDELSLPPGADRFGDFNPMLQTRLFYPRRLDRPAREEPRKKPSRGGEDRSGNLPFD